MRMKDSTVFRIARGANPGLFVLGILCITLLAIAPAADAAELPGLTVMGVAPDGTETPLDRLPLAGGGGPDLPRSG